MIRVVKLFFFSRFLYRPSFNFFKVTGVNCHYFDIALIKGQLDKLKKLNKCITANHVGVFLDVNFLTGRQKIFEYRLIGSTINVSQWILVAEAFMLGPTDRNFTPLGSAEKREDPWWAKRQVGCSCIWSVSLY